MSQKNASHNFIVEVVVGQNHADVDVEEAVGDGFNGDVVNKGNQEGGR